MDLDFGPEDLAFRDELRAFIADTFDDDMRARSARSKIGDVGREARVRWFRRLAAKGWSDAQKYIFSMEMTLAGAPTAFTGIGGPRDNGGAEISDASRTDASRNIIR